MALESSSQVSGAFEKYFVCYCHKNSRFLISLLYIVSALIILTFVIIRFMLRASTSRLVATMIILGIYFGNYFEDIDFENYYEDTSADNFSGNIVVDDRLRTEIISGVLW